jgi:hypothetical protein
MRSQGRGVYLCPSRVDHGLVYGVQCASRLAELLVCQPILGELRAWSSITAPLCITQNFSKPRSVIQELHATKTVFFFLQHFHIHMNAVQFLNSDRR